MLGADEVHIIPRDVSPGEPAKIAAGNPHGLHAAVTQVMPGEQRVALFQKPGGQKPGGAVARVRTTSDEFCSSGSAAVHVEGLANYNKHEHFHRKTFYSYFIEIVRGLCHILVS